MCTNLAAVQTAVSKEGNCMCSSGTVTVQCGCMLHDLLLLTLSAECDRTRLQFRQLSVGSKEGNCMCRIGTVTVQCGCMLHDLLLLTLSAECDRTRLQFRQLSVGSKEGNCMCSSAL